MKNLEKLFKTNEKMAMKRLENIENKWKTVFKGLKKLLKIIKKKKESYHKSDNLSLQLESEEYV